ncbi:uncharacterized protein SCODWIG_03858 [Saccharomycodes ludwigii]|uniref:DBF4-type domain-containing protein n=1 Tax=Saccharomycodes ludwigii TaxID=36035 RepID=A0A376BBV1_9ASCO|nr:hypothetical protein SCDLUD_003729 [Saccharomycodes ludwigii]KAH3900725.1 hypothetical protein SCDLUD_003729 [Saccharomycodes ludwigii]SSD62096.1 uncharacterized protein SCODWIG_03858 [Saccharomycodes ludwigii]
MIDKNSRKRVPLIETNANKVALPTMCATKINKTELLKVTPLIKNTGITVINKELPVSHSINNNKKQIVADVEEEKEGKNEKLTVIADQQPRQQEEEKDADVTELHVLKKLKHNNTTKIKATKFCKRSIDGALFQEHPKILPVLSNINALNTTLTNKRKFAIMKSKTNNITSSNAKKTSSINTTLKTNNQKLISDNISAKKLVKQPKKAVVSNSLDMKNWQQNWKQIMKKGTRIYFDIINDAVVANTTNNNSPNNSDINETYILLRNAFISLGAEIKSFFDTHITIVITTRSNISDYSKLPENDVLNKAHHAYMKIWNFDKAQRFLKNLDVDIHNYNVPQDNYHNTDSSMKNKSLSHYLKNEKLYGPTDRDPFCKRDDIHYFKSFVPHLYIYDLNQQFSPIIAIEWPKNDNTNKPVGYPKIKFGSLGRCPFVGDEGYDELQPRRILKRYKRDKLNENYALILRRLYSETANPNPSNNLYIIDTKYMDSEKLYNEEFKIIKGNMKNSDATNLGNTLTTDGENRPDKCDLSITNRLPPKATWKRQNLDNDGTTTINCIENNSNEKRGPPALIRFETAEFEESQRKRLTPFEIKASGVNLSNDTGNGLAPTKSSVVNKTLQHLNKLVVERNNNSKPPTLNNMGGASTSISNATSNSTSVATTAVSATLNVTNSGRTGGASSTINHNNTSKFNSTKINKIFTINDSSLKHGIKNNTSTVTKIRTPAQPQPQAIKDKKLGGGYCENCRVKYERLSEHIKTEKHQEFANNDLNFKAIDSLIEDLHVAIALESPTKINKLHY